MAACAIAIFRSVLHSSKPNKALRTLYKPLVQRSYCSTSKLGDQSEGGLQEIANQLHDAENTPIRDDFVTESGQVVYSFDQSVNLEEKSDWSAFEKQFGVHDDQLADDAAEHIHIQTLDPGEKLELMEAENGWGDVFDWSKESGMSSMIGGDSLQELFDKSVSATTDEAASDTIRIMRHVGKSAAAAPSDSLAVPPNRKRPGYERRVASMQRDMERVVEQELCVRQSEWYAHANLHSVLLSPNLRNLTIYYELDGAAEHSRGENARVAKAVRAALAERLHIRYVPRVFLQRVGEKRRNEVDAVFEQISADRAK